MREIKPLLEIDPDDPTDDKRLLFLTDMASSWIMELCNRPGWDWKQRTEFYGGTGTEKLLLKSRPVYVTPRPRVWVDSAGNFGSTSGAFADSTELTWGDDFYLWVDQDDELTSRCGILIRRNSLWSRQPMRTAGLMTPYLGKNYGTIKVTYYGGYFVDNLPSVFRQACAMLVAKLLTVFPLGAEITSDSYEDRNVSISVDQKNKILGPILPMIVPFRNWNW